MEKRKISLEQMLPLIEEKLKAGGTVEIPITGTSMLPLLVERRDSVVLKSAPEKLEKYDLPLFRRSNGAFVLHRIMNSKGEKYTMCGDNQWVMEAGIERNQIIGVVCFINRKGRQIDVNSFGYRLYCRIWRANLPVRKYIVALRGKLRK